MLIDSTHKEEIRVAIVDDSGKLEEFDFETAEKQNLKGNIYLAKVIRIEPSLQAAFVEYGGNRHGFLAFDDIHTDYFKVPISERSNFPEEEVANVEDGVDEEDFTPRRRSRIYKDYKIQEVIKRGQVMLVQVVKEERGNKGAALTTYLSLAGRYCVLMPNSGNGCGGVSRKISDIKTRKRLKSIIETLEIPESMGLIIRTAGVDRTKIEIRKDCDYLMRLWNDIRDKTLISSAPKKIHEESELIKRALRDLYSRDVDKVFVEGDDGYREAKDFIKNLMPSHAKKIQQYKVPNSRLFHEYKVDEQIEELYSTSVKLKSGGYLVINPTEALVSIDINSGKSTKERHIEETAFKTNMEAAEEIARVLRLRDLAGLVVIDFIDMDDEKNIHTVERKFRESLKNDRARIQVGKISNFGLLEMSRQRLRPSIFETATFKCPHCHGQGVIRSTESSALQSLRNIENWLASMGDNVLDASVTLSPEVWLYILNKKRDIFLSIEQRFEVKISMSIDSRMLPSDILIEAKALKRPLENRKRVSFEKKIEEATLEASPLESTIETEVLETEDSIEVKKVSRSARRRRNRLEKKKRQIEMGTENQEAVTQIELNSSESEDETSQLISLDASANEDQKKNRRNRFRTRRRQQEESSAEKHEPRLEEEKKPSFPENNDVIEKTLEDKKRPSPRSRERKTTLEKSSKNAAEFQKEIVVDVDSHTPRPLFDGLMEEKKLVLTGETFRLGRSFGSSITQAPRTEVADLILKTSEQKKEEEPQEKSEVSKPKKGGRTWWQKLLK